MGQKKRAFKKSEKGGEKVKANGQRRQSESMDLATLTTLGNQPACGENTS